MKFEALDKGMFQDSHQQGGQTYRKLDENLEGLPATRKLGVRAVLGQMGSTGIKEVAVFETNDKFVTIGRGDSMIDAVIQPDGAVRACSYYWLPEAQKPKG